MINRVKLSKATKQALDILFTTKQEYSSHRASNVPEYEINKWVQSSIKELELDQYTEKVRISYSGNTLLIVGKNKEGYDIFVAKNTGWVHNSISRSDKQ